MDISGILSFFAKLKPDALALVDDSNEITFSQLDTNVRRIARLLQINEIDTSSLVCTMLPSTLDWQVTLALHILGASSFSKPVGSRLDPVLKPDWLISTQLNPDFPEDKTFVVDSNFEKAVNQTDKLKDAPGFTSPEFPARYFFTSGTSGASKYLVVSAENLLAKIKNQGSSELVGDRDSLNLWQFGSTQSYRVALRSLNEGRTFYNCGFYDYRLPKILVKYPIRTISGSPIQISSMVDSLIQTGTKLPKLQTVIMGGSAPTQIQVNRIRQHLSARIYNSYGSTELGFVSMHEIAKGRTLGGIISPEVKLEIVDENNAVLPKGEVGIIRYAKAKMPKSYFNSEAATNEYFQDDFFYPGDLGFLDEMGHLHISGRTNEVMNLGGVKISPESVEEVALRTPGILDAAAFSVIDKKGVKRLALAYTASSEFSLDDLEASYKKEALAISISKYVEVEEIPRNENGKIPRSNLAELIFESGSKK